MVHEPQALSGGEEEAGPPDELQARVVVKEEESQLPLLQHWREPSPADQGATLKGDDEEGDCVHEAEGANEEDPQQVSLICCFWAGRAKKHVIEGQLLV